MTFAVGVKDLRPISSEAPWSEDPYDALFSLVPFFVAFVGLVTAVRLALCRRNEPLPVSRLLGVIRGSALILGSVLATLGAGWLSVLASPPATTMSRLLAIILGVETAIAILVGTYLWLVSRSVPALPSAVRGRDWLDDVLELLDRPAAGIAPGAAGPLRRMTSALGAGAERIRRHPLTSAAAIAFAVGAFAGLGATAEGDPPILVLLIVGIGAAAMLSFILVAGSYLRLVRRDPAGGGVALQPLRAVVAAAASIPIAVAFRDSLWWIVGSTADAARLEQFAALLAVVSGTTLGVAIVFEMLIARRRPRR